MKQKRTGRRTGGRQANIVGTASSASGFGGLSGVAGNTGVTLTKTTSPVSPAGLSTVGGGLQVSGSTRVTTPVVIGGGSSGSGGSSGGSTGGSVVTKPAVTQPTTPTVTPKPVVTQPTTPMVTPKPVVTQPTTPTVTPKPVVTQPTTPTVTPKPVVTQPTTPAVTPTPVVTQPTTPTATPTIPVVVIEKPVSGSGNSDLPVETLPVVVIEKPITGGVDTTPVVTPSPTTPDVHDDKEADNGGSAGSGFGDRFVVNPSVKDKLEFNEEMKTEDVVMEEKSTTPGFGGMDGLAETVGGKIEDVLTGETEEAPYVTPGFGDGFYTRIPEDGMEMPEPEKVTNENPKVPTANTPAKSGSGKKWVWLIVAVVAAWFIFKKK